MRAASRRGSIAASIVAVSFFAASAGPAHAARATKSRRQLRRQVDLLLDLGVEVRRRPRGYAVIFWLPATAADDGVKKGRSGPSKEARRAQIVVEPAPGRADVWIREYLVAEGDPGGDATTTYTGRRTVIKRAARRLRKRKQAAKRAARLVARYTSFGDRLQRLVDSD